MAGTRQIEKQIETIDGLSNIVHTMRSLAATYLHRAQEQLGGVRSYAETVGRAIGDCLRGREIALPERAGANPVVVAVFSEQGMCGRFNEVLAEAAEQRASDIEDPRFVAIGRRGPGLLRRMGLPVVAELPGTYSPAAVNGVIHGLARTVLELHETGAFTQLFLLYARYLSPGRIQPEFERILPIDLSQWQGTGGPAHPPQLGPPRLALLNDLVNEYAFISLFRAMIESIASENGMRLQSMEAARDNIEETLGELRLKARIQRQNDITDELLDVVSGAEALGEEDQEQEQA